MEFSPPTPNPPTEVRFDDAAEVEFAIACVDTMIQLFDKDGLSLGFRQDEIDALASFYANISTDLRQMIDTTTQANQELLRRGRAVEINFIYEGHRGAGVVQRCIGTVLSSERARKRFPADRLDLLVLFGAVDPETPTEA